MQCALSRGFYLDSLITVAQLYINHGFLSENEADLFLADIPVLGEHNEQEATVTDQMLIPIVIWEILWLLPLTNHD